MALIIVALQQDAAIDFKVPKADCAVFVSRCNQATLGEEGHAAELGVFGGLHFSDNLQLFVVPEQDRVVETCRNDLRRVWNLLEWIVEHLAGL